MSADDDRYLRPEELAQYSTIGVRQLRAYSQDAAHPLPCHHIGRRVLYKRSEFDQRLRERESRQRPRSVDRAYQIALAIRGHR